MIINDSLPYQHKLRRFPKRLVIIFAIIMLFGFMPWEQLLSIQIQNATLIWLTSISMGLGGLLGLLGALIVYIMRNYGHFFYLLGLSVLCLLTACMFIISLVIPDFKWEDTDVYRSGGDYLVVQQFELKDNDDRFNGDYVNFEGKTWHKEKKRYY